MASTYSFDVVSDFDRQELVNTLDQVRREVGNRYDLKGSNTEISLEENEIIITTISDMTLQAVEDILRSKATKRNLSLKIFDFQLPETVGGNRIKLIVKRLNRVAIHNTLRKLIAFPLHQQILGKPISGHLLGILGR